MKRRILPMIMAVMMILSIIQVPAWAATGDDPAGEDGNPGQVSEQPVEESAEPSAPVEEPAPEEQAENYVAEVNSQGFTTLQAAIDAANGAGITLLADVKDCARITLSQGETVNINLNDHDIGFAQGDYFYIRHGTLNLTGNGEVYEQSPYYGAVLMKGGAEDVSNYSVVTVGANVTLRGWAGLFIDKNDNDNYGIVANVYGTLESVRDTTGAGGHALYVNGTITATEGNVPKITLDGATLNTEAGNGMYLAGYAETSIRNSTITSSSEGSTGIEIRAGKLTITGSTVTGGSGEYEGGPNGNGSTSSNVALAVVQHTTKLPLEVTVNGGTFSGGAAFVQADEQDNGEDAIKKIKIDIQAGKFEGQVYSENVENFISGGTFSDTENITSENYLTDSVKLENNEVTPLGPTDEASVAQVGSTYYKSLSAAIAAAGDGDTVTLLKNTNEDIVIPEEAELILDLNGKTLTNVSGDTITNNGTLTITGDGTVDNVTHGKAAIQNEPGGTVVLNGGAYTRSKENGKSDVDSGGNSYYNIVNHGTMEINDGVSVTQTGHFSSMIENGWYDGNQNKGNQNSVLTINGGTFSGGLNTIKNDDYGELTINDGTFENMSQATFLNWNIATVNGGTFNARNASSGAILNGYINDSMDQGELTINGGTFNAGEQNAVIATMNGAHSGDIEITGGTLNGSIVLTDNKGGAQLTITQDAKINGNVTNSGKADVAITDGATVSGQVSNGTNGTMSVVNSTIGSVPQDTTSDSIVIVNSYVDNVLITNTGDKAIMVGGKTYDTMAEAIEVVGYGQTIYVLKDIPDAVGIAVPSNKNFTIDFGGHTYTLIGPGAGSSGTETNGFQLLRDSTITFKNGTIRIAEGANNIKRIIQNYADLTLEDMHIYAENQVPDENYALSFNNGDITFKGDTDVITTSDDVIAFDICKFSNYPSASVTFDESYTGTINGKIVYDSPNAETHKLVIQGDGTFGTIEPGSTAGADTAANSGITITSGHFADPVKEEYLADSVKAQLKSASNSEAPYSYYPSVEDAIAAAKPGDTVTAVNTEPTKEKYTVTLNFNDGKTDNLTYEVSGGIEIDLPTPSRSGYTFEGWYDGNTRVSDPYNVTKTVTLTAEWDYKDDDHGSSSSGSVRRYDIEADAGRGGDISPDGRVRVRRGENQTFRITADDGYEIYDVEVDGESVGAVSRYTFENVREDHTISATFRQTGAQTEEAQLPFLDVAEGAWYYDAVAYCYENGIMDGTSSVSFAPGMLLNRAMAAQVLYNLV